MKLYLYDKENLECIILFERNIKSRNVVFFICMKYVRVGNFIE